MSPVRSGTWLVFLLLLFIASSVSGEGAKISAVRIGNNFVLDGNIQEAEWGHIAPLPLVMHSPNFNSEPTEKSEIRLAYDQDYIYLSGVLYTQDHSSILGNSKKRDALVGSADFFGFAIDTYNDKNNALAFFTTPSGLRWDGAVFNDAQGQLPINLSWNNFWDVAVAQNDKGWYVEMRIPFTSLQFQPTDGKVIMGFTAWRYIAAKNEISIYPAIAPEYGDWSAFKPSKFEEIEFEGIQASKPFYITPYALGGYSDRNNLNEAETAYLHETEGIYEFGLDVKYGLSNNWTLDLSYNTDFAQVEADDQQVNLTRFSLFFPEKRLFFQERSGIFNYNFGRQDKLFYSRRIGIDDGEVIPIYGGVRLVGRSGDLDIGFISMQTEAIEDLNSINNSVFRLKKRVVNENSEVGFILTNKSDLKGAFNTTYGLDATLKVFKEDFLSLRWAQTLENENPNELFSFDPTRWWISLSRRSQRGFTYGTSISRAGKYFNPELGFNVRENFLRFGSRLDYNWFQDENSSIFKHGFSSGGSIHWNNEDHKIESLGWRIGWNLQTKSGWMYNLNFRPNYERLLEPFELSDDVEIPVGTYDYYGVEMAMNTSFSSPMVIFLKATGGEFFDGTQLSAGITLQYNVSPSLEFNTTYEYNKLNFADRDQQFLVHLARLKTLYMFSTRTSLAAFVQYNSKIKSALANIRFRYNPREGNDLYIVLNGDQNYNLNREFPVLPEFTERTILVKYSYTLSK